MKDKRNCMNNNYPMYQPMMVPPMGYPIGYQGFNNTEQINNLEQQIDLLDKRVSRLESLASNNNTNYNKYNDSNYYMV